MYINIGEFIMAIGIYCLSFDNTDKVYIGKSITLETRLYSHLWNMRRNQSAKKLQEAYNTYGEPTFHILLECAEYDIYKLEKFYIQEFDSYNNGFNSSPGGEAGNVSPGELNPRANSSNETYLEALKLLVNTNLTAPQIAEITKLSKSTIAHISSGEGHKWMKEVVPELYDKLIQTKKSRRIRTNSTKRPFNKLKSPDGIVYDITNVGVNKFCEEHKLSPSKVSLVLNGRADSTKGWTPL
jgi:group I intron endonuclease